jgi:hypothetical protein
MSRWKLNIKNLGSSWEIRIETIERIYKLKSKQYLDYYWIQKSIIQNVGSRYFKRSRDQLAHINCSYIFLPTTCTSKEDVDLVWEDFSKLYSPYFNIIILEHALITFPNLLYFWLYTRKRKDTIGWAKMHTTKFLELGTRKITTIMNLNVSQKQWSNLMDLQVTKKENVPLFLMHKCQIQVNI